jgi:nucleotide-binding universal stress UspA family protein
MNLSLMGSTLLVGVDFSLACEWSLRRAVTLAERSQARLELVHVVEWEGQPGLSSAAADDVADLQRTAWTGQAQVFLGHLGQLCSYLVADRVPAHIQVLIGDPATGLLLAAERASAAVIMLGAEGRGRAVHRSRGVVGRTAARVSAASPNPVLLTSWPHRAPAVGHGQGLLAAPDPQSWSCSRCGVAQSPGAATRVCAACGDVSSTWISLAPAGAPFANASLRSESRRVRC